jgi:hypothetical protein
VHATQAPVPATWPRVEVAEWASYMETLSEFARTAVLVDNVVRAVSERSDDETALGLLGKMLEPVSLRVQSVNGELRPYLCSNTLVGHVAQMLAFDLAGGASTWASARGTRRHSPQPGP